MNYPLEAELLNGAIFAGAVLLFALPALWRGRAGYALLAVLATFADTFTRLWPDSPGSPLHIIHGAWIWNGDITNLIWSALLVAFLVGAGLFARQDFGLTWRQNPGTWRAALLVIVPLLAATDALVLHFAHHETFTAEDIAWQMTLPGITEELFFRGLLLALFDRMFPKMVMIFGAPMGYGAIATSLVFGLVHMVHVTYGLQFDFNPLFGISPLIGAFVAVWIRKLSGSLVVGTLAHNISNTVCTVVPAFF